MYNGRFKTRGELGWSQIVRIIIWCVIIVLGIVVISRIFNVL